MSDAKRVFLAPATFLENINGIGAFFYRGTVVDPAVISDDQAADLEAKGLIGLVDVEDGVPVVADVPEGVPDESWTVAQIDAYIVTEGITVPAGSNKGEKLRVILDVLAAREGRPDDLP